MLLLLAPVLSFPGSLWLSTAAYFLHHCLSDILFSEQVTVYAKNPAIVKQKMQICPYFLKDKENISDIIVDHNIGPA